MLCLFIGYACTHLDTLSCCSSSCRLLLRHAKYVDSWLCVETGTTMARVDCYSYISACVVALLYLVLVAVATVVSTFATFVTYTVHE